MYYHVRGKNGGSSKEGPDDKNSDTRWVQLKELVMNMDDSQLTSLDTCVGWAAAEGGNRREEARAAGPAREQPVRSC